MTPNHLVKRRAFDSIYDQLTDRQRAWIESLKPTPVATEDKSQILQYLLDKRLPATTYAIKTAIASGELPSKLVGRARRVSQFDALVWAVSRGDQQVSA